MNTYLWELLKKNTIKTEIAPPLIVLREEEKFMDYTGNIFDIELRGYVKIERKSDIYCKAKDVMKLFNVDVNEDFCRIFYCFGVNHLYISTDELLKIIKESTKPIYGILKQWTDKLCNGDINI